MDLNSIRTRWQRWRQQAVRASTALKELFWAALAQNVVRWCAYGAEIVLLLVLVALYASSFRLASSGMDSGFSKAVSSSVIRLWVDPATLTAAQYQLSVGIAVSLCIAINTVMLGVVVPLAAVAGFRRNARIVEVSPADRVDLGRDTLAHLLKNADKAIIFAGSFDWICDHDRMLPIVRQLAQRESVYLVSNRPYAKVEESFAAHGQLWEHIKDRIVCSRPQKLLLTVAYYGHGAIACCSMVKRSDNTVVNIVIRDTKDEARMIAKIIDQLCGGWDKVSADARKEAGNRSTGGAT